MTPTLLSMPQKFAALVAFGVCWGLILGYAIGVSEAQPPDAPAVAEVADLRWELDVLHGKTAAGIEMCWAAYDANPWTP